VTREYDYYARQLRLVDSAIQNANWTTEKEVPDSVMTDYDDQPKCHCSAPATATLSAPAATSESTSNAPSTFESLVSGSKA
jgi:hypothetical protein